MTRLSREDRDGRVPGGGTGPRSGVCASEPDPITRDPGPDGMDPISVGVIGLYRTCLISQIDVNELLLLLFNKRHRYTVPEVDSRTERSSL